MMVAAAKVHSHDNLIPSELLSLRLQLVFVDEIRHARLMEETPPLAISKISGVFSIIDS